MSKSKLLPSVLFVILASFLGLCLGTTIGGMFFVPPGSGLAGPAIALGYGALGLVGALVLSIVLARRLTVQRLRTALLGVGIASLMVIVVLVYRAQTNRTEFRDRETVESPYQKPYQLTLRVTDRGLNHPDNRLPFREVRVEQDGTHRQMQIISAEPNPQKCQGQLEPLEGVDISSALMHVAVMVSGSMRGCTHDTTGAPLYHLKWNLTGFGDALEKGSLAITAGCLRADESPGELLALLNKIYLRLSQEMECKPHQPTELNAISPNRNALSIVAAAILPRQSWANNSNTVTQQLAPQPLGIGMVKPRMAAERPLYFYSQPDFHKLADQMPAVDSLTFFQNEHYIDIRTAPPWFYPEVMKLDYNLLFLRAVTLTKNWIEVVVNRQSGITRWVDRHAVEFIHWPTFMLDVAAVEVMALHNNPVRLKPLDHAGVVAETEGAILRPLAIRERWMQVLVGNLHDSNVPTGWIRWHDDDKLVITYSLLE